VGEASERGRFAQESLGGAVAGAIGAQEFDGYAAIELWIVRRVDDALPAASEAMEQLVATDARERCCTAEETRFDLGAEAGAFHGIVAGCVVEEVDEAIFAGIGGRGHHRVER